MKDLLKTLKNEKIQGLRLRSPLSVSISTPLKEVLTRMKEARRGYVIVLKNQKITGIFTERDAMTRVVEQEMSLSTPIEKLMTPNPKVLKMEDSVADAVQLMSHGSYRHIPLVDDAGNLKGVLGVRDLLQYLAEHFPCEVYNLPPDPQQIIRSPEGA